MSITLTGTGGLFTRLGKAANLYLNLAGFMSATAPSASNTTWASNNSTIRDLGHAVDQIDAQYQSTGQNLTEGIYTARDSYRSSGVGSLGSALAQLGERTVVTMVDDAIGLQSRTLASALPLLIADMDTGSEKVRKNVVSHNVTADSGNTGDPTVCCTFRNGKGVDRENVFNETIELRVTTDRQNGGTAGSESLSLTGEPSVAATAWNYPQGSGATGSLTMIDPCIDASSSGNLLTNSDFNSFNGTTPTSWNVVVGTAGTDIAAGGTSYYADATNCLKFVGDNSTLSTVAQNVTLATNTVYHVYGIIKGNATLGGGVLALSLCNSSHTVIADDKSNSNTVSQNLTSIGTSWTVFKGSFSTPKVLPSTTELKIHLTTAVPSAKQLYIQVALAKVLPAYTGGPYISAVRGATDVAIGDKISVSVDNDYAGKFQSLFDRWFAMRDKDIQLPSAAAANATISEALVG